jgi:hypothetical protein
MNSWQKYVKDNKGPGVTLKSLAVKYRAQTGGQIAQGVQSKELKIKDKYECNGECSKHVKQLNVYIKFLHKALADDVLKADKISDTAQIVLFCNVWLLNLVTYYFDHYGKEVDLTTFDINNALVYGNNHADKPEALKFRTAFFKWMGSEDYAELLNSINLGCAVDSTEDMKHDYIIKIACIGYGINLMFAKLDLQEVSNYMNASWFTTFVKDLKRETTSVSNECMPRVSLARKGLNLITSVASTAGKVALATGKGVMYAAPIVGKAAVVTGKGVAYAAPIAGKVAWYAGEKSWYAGEKAANIAAKIPGVRAGAGVTWAIVDAVGRFSMNMQLGTNF